MLAELTMDYIPIEASDLYDTALGGTNSRYTKDNLLWKLVSRMDLKTCQTLRQSGGTSRGTVNFYPIKACHMTNAITRAPQ